MVSPLDRKLLRDLSSLRGQVITIALVVACGITSYITMRTAYDSLVASRDQYYEEHRFADLFAQLKRAPRALGPRLESIQGVAEVQTRVVESVLVPIEDMPRPATGTVVGVARHAEEELNRVYIKRGRALDPKHTDEVLVIEGFADAHGLEPGDSIKAVINSTLRELRIVGVALSPEYVMTLAPGQLSYDPGLSPILWMNESALEAAFQMEGAFNNVTFRLARDANIRGVQAQVDAELRPFGGLGSVGQDKQISNYMLSGELMQLDNMAGFVPYLFLSVAALLVNVVLSRLVQLQRGVIATLKAVGYRNLTIGLHYLKLVSVIVSSGAIAGVMLGAWLGNEMMGMYTGQYFRFPNPEYILAPSAVFFSVGVSVASAVLGAWVAVRRVVAMPPAEAMQPPAPARYRRSFLERVGLWRLLHPVVRMIWRELTRRPVRLVLSSVGISLAIGIVVVSRSMWDSMEYLIDVQFHRSMREDLNVTFSRPLPKGALSSLRNLSGVQYVEALRAVPVRLRAGHRFRDSVINGYPDVPTLRHLLDDEARSYPVPEDGILLTKKLGEILDVGIGDKLTVELREGEFATKTVNVVGLVAEPFGLAGHMNQRSLSALIGDTGPVNTALLTLDDEKLAGIEERLKVMPAVASVSSPKDFKRQFNEQSAAMMNVFTFVMSLFATIIAVGVIYNNARVALSQRNRDLASLRVLGFTRREIATILFGEQAVQVCLSIPIGLWVGHAMTQAMMSNADPETYRLPVMVSARTYLFAIVVAVGSALLSALLLRRKLNRLDLIGVLKTRE